MTSGRHQLVDGIMLSLGAEDKSAIQEAPGPMLCVCVCQRVGEDVCLYTDIHECMCARQTRKVLDGVSRLISHYGWGETVDE